MDNRQAASIYPCNAGNLPGTVHANYTVTNNISSEYDHSHCSLYKTVKNRPMSQKQNKSVKKVKIQKMVQNLIKRTQ